VVSGSITDKPRRLKEFSMKKKYEKHKSTRHASFSLRRNDVAKRAGINRLAITSMSSDWRIDDTTISLSLRDAQTLRKFLNENLD
jgi:hypothetical protein